MNDQINQLPEDRYFYLDVHQAISSKGTLTGLIGFLLIGLLFSGEVWWIKGLFSLGGIIFFFLTYLDVRYFLGLHKTPNRISSTTRSFRYYNEFEGNKEILIDQIREIKIYLRGKKAFLLEVFVDGEKHEENIRIDGLDTPSQQDLLDLLHALNPKIVFSTNRKTKEFTT